MAKESGTAFDLNLFKRLLAFTRPYRITFYGTALTAIALTVFAVYTPLILRDIVDIAIREKDENLLWDLSLLMLAVLIGQVVCQLLFTYYANLLGESVIRDLRKQLFGRMLKFSMKYYNKSSIGVLVTRAVADMQRIGEIFSQGFFMIVADLLKMLAASGIMLYLNWRLALIVFAILPLILYATRVFQKKMKVAFTEVRAQVSNLNSFVQERLTGMKIVQLFTREDQESAQFREINEKHQNAWLKTVWYNSFFFPIAEIVTSIAIGLIAWYGVLQDITEPGTENLGNIFAFIMLIEMLFRPLRQIADKFNTLQMGMVAAGRVFKILDTESRIEDAGDFDPDRIAGGISFEKVHFSYEPGEEVLHGISFALKPGEKVAIVGATGAGKSTIINLLNRFYDIDSGTILLDDRSIQDYRLSSLRSNIAVVQQDVFLFADTIENNITLQDSRMGKEEIEAAAKAIGVHDFISSLPGGYAYNVKERGSMLSQRPATTDRIPSSLYEESSILVLDEATSSVDTYTEQLIQRATEKVTENRTSIIIAHRLATIKQVDKILVMEAGNIVESGSHEALLKQKGYYHKLYEAQFMAEEVL